MGKHLRVTLTAPAPEHDEDLVHDAVGITRPHLAAMKQALVDGGFPADSVAISRGVFDDVPVKDVVRRPRGPNKAKAPLAAVPAAAEAAE